jgi:uncharacterized protein YndB with AHSA1/START domain
MADKPEKRELTIIRSFDAPLDKVWKAWTDEKLVAQWFGPRGVTNPICRVDAKKGGEIYIVMKAGKELGPAEGMEWPMKATFDEVVPMKRLAFTGTGLDDKQGIIIENRQTVTFAEENGKTRLTIQVLVTKVVGAAGQAAVAGMEMGFNQQLEKLGELLNSR